ncbi:hypothetical protein KFE25_007495 [Diacronema lutheri]|uniref:C2 domain-containing protein n=2 Tax=Diacronema lutheri TaxID=2081491 RepID=A0A8J5XV56_DIALT|nr:hypothetical protein KFE25_007495 [Diacronema lutheri]
MAAARHKVEAACLLLIVWSWTARAQTVAACVVGADDLADADNGRAGDLDDTYVLTRARGTARECRTSTRANSDSPTWRECCSLGELEPDAVIDFEVFDVDVFRSDELVGRASAEARTAERWLDLTVDGSAAGALRGRLLVRVQVDGAAGVQTVTVPGAAALRAAGAGTGVAVEPANAHPATRLASLEALEWNYAPREYTPAFSPEHSHYTVEIPPEIDVLIVRATSADGADTVLLNDQPMEAGGQSLVRLQDGRADGSAGTLLRLRAAAGAPEYVLRVIAPSPSPPPAHSPPPPASSPRAVAVSAVPAAAPELRAAALGAQRTRVGGAPTDGTQPTGSLFWLSVASSTRAVADADTHLSPELSAATSVYQVVVGCESDAVTVHAVATSPTDAIAAVRADGRPLARSVGRLTASWPLALRDGDLRARRQTASPTLELRVERSAGARALGDAASKLITLVVARPPLAVCEPRVASFAVRRADGSHGSAPLALVQAELAPTTSELALRSPVVIGQLRVELAVSRTCRLRVLELLPVEPGIVLALDGWRAAAPAGARADVALAGPTPRLVSDVLTGPWDRPVFAQWGVRAGANELRIELARADDADSLIRSYIVRAEGVPPANAGARPRARAQLRARVRRALWALLLAVVACVLVASLFCVMLAAAQRCAFALSSGWSHGERKGEELARASRVQPRARVRPAVTLDADADEAGHSAAAESGANTLLAAARDRPLELSATARRALGLDRTSGRTSAVHCPRVVPCPSVLSVLALLTAIALVGWVVQTLSERPSGK